jgi:hypothetical protein
MICMHSTNFLPLAGDHETHLMAVSESPNCKTLEQPHSAEIYAVWHSKSDYGTTGLMKSK